MNKKNTNNKKKFIVKAYFIKQYRSVMYRHNDWIYGEWTTNLEDAIKEIEECFNLYDDMVDNHMPRIEEAYRIYDYVRHDKGIDIDNYYSSAPNNNGRDKYNVKLSILNNETEIKKLQEDNIKTIKNKNKKIKNQNKKMKNQNKKIKNQNKKINKNIKKFIKEKNNNSVFHQNRCDYSDEDHYFGYACWKAAGN